MAPEDHIRRALLRVADNVAKHTTGRDGWNEKDRCFVVDLREAEAEIVAAIREAEQRGAEKEREACALVAEKLQRCPGQEILRIVNDDHEEAGRAIAAAIRARKE